MADEEEQLKHVGDIAARDGDEDANDDEEGDDEEEEVEDEYEGAAKRQKTGAFLEKEVGFHAADALRPGQGGGFPSEGCTTRCMIWALLLQI